MSKRRSSLKSDNSGNERFEPKLLKAIEAGDVARVRDVLEEAQVASRPVQGLVDIGLSRACDKKNIDLVKFLLNKGADPNHLPQSKQPILSRAAELGHNVLVNTLLGHHVNLEAPDKKGRTALMTAAWKNHFGIVRSLILAGARVDTVDNRKRNVLHNIAADRLDERGPGKGTDKTRQRCSMDVVDYLIQSGINLDSRDMLERTALHWSAVTDNEQLMLRLLQTNFRGGSSRAETNAIDSRMKTPLHLAATHDRPHLARILVDRGANVHAKSDGGWTALHNACSVGSMPLLEIFMAAGADINCELLNGRMPLHVAAEAGHTAIAQRLLQHPGVKRTAKDRFGNTPLLIAAEHKRLDIVEMLAPWNHITSLSTYEIDASKQFSATIVDFGNFRNGNKVTRKTVYDLLYARDHDGKKHIVSTLPENTTGSEFRWIHLPANNIAWCDALLTKRFIEDGAKDFEGYKALESSFSQQHRGQRHHSRFMRPMCQVVQRTTPEIDELVFDERKEIPAVVVSEPKEISTDAVAGAAVSEARHSNQNDAPKSPRGKAQKGKDVANASNISLPKSPKNKTNTSTAAINRDQPKIVKRQPARQQSKSSVDTLQAARSGKASYNIYMFMPYLHFETDTRRQEMQRAMDNVDILHQRGTLLTEDEILVRAHLTASSSFLHVRRTLDQFFYHNIDTGVRDTDQVVYRYQKNSTPDCDPKIFMVDQLWMWVLGNIVVTSFPQRWRQPRNDPLNVLDGIIQDINSKSRESVQNVYELATMISGRCFGTFDRHRKHDGEFQFFDMFEASIGSAMDGEAGLFQDFSKASRQASAWLQRHQRPSRFTTSMQIDEPQTESENDSRWHFDVRGHRREPLFVDKLLDVGAETDLLAEIKDIRDELDIIRMVLDSQKHLLPDLREAIKVIYKDERSFAQVRKIDKIYDEQLKTIDNPLKDLTRMDKQAERIYTSIRDLLDLKQKHANAFEARFARDQATGTVRQGQTIMVFTVVTVIFLPLSFIASFFAINVNEFPHNSQGQQTMGIDFVSEYIFGIGLAISIPCIILALTVDEVGWFMGGLKKKIQRSWWTWRSRRKHNPEAEMRLQTLDIERAISQARSLRRSVEVEWKRPEVRAMNGRHKEAHSHWTED